MRTHAEDEKREIMRELGLISLLVLLWGLVFVWALYH